MADLYNNWCRLCARNDAVKFNIFSTNLGNSNLRELILNYFKIVINLEDKISTKICCNCYEFMENLIKFHESVEKTNKMFLKILSKEDINKQNNEKNQLNNINCKSIKSELIECTNISTESNQILPIELVNVSIKSENFDSTEMINLGSSLEIPIENIKIKKRIRKTTNKLINKSKSKKPVSKCKICDSSFPSRRNLEDHIKLAHVDYQFECEICHKKFGTEKSLKVHKDIHLPYEQRYECPYCDQKFTKATSVKPHIRAVHLGEKPFVCEECGKVFGTKRNLMDHMYTHNTETIYKCSHCCRSFKNQRFLQIHMNVQH